MANITVTPANVTAGAGAVVQRSYNAGASITAGQTVYLDPATNLWQLASANTSQATAVVAGIALHAASAGQPLAVQVGGTINIGATVAVGTIYVLGATAGSIAPVADALTGWYTSIVGVAVTTTSLLLTLQVANVAKP
jgi:hypothetical protein